MSKGNTGRPVRFDDETWSRFGEIATQRGTTRAALIRAYVLQEIERARSATGDLFDQAPASRGRRA